MPKHFIILLSGIPGFGLAAGGWLLLNTGVFNSILGALMLVIGVPLLLFAVGCWLAERNRESKQTSSIASDLHSLDHVEVKHLESEFENYDKRFPVANGDKY